MSKSGQFCWNELCTSDVHAAKEFYGKVFGWQFKEIALEDMTYTIIKCNDNDIAGIWRVPTEKQGTIPPHWMSYILVEDINDALNKAKKHGAVEVKGVTQIGTMGLFAIVTDPMGAHFAMWEVLHSD